jgi:ATP-dependent helicase/nuclease subunit B
VPESYELTFGNGKIDRVDICEDQDAVYVKILDYKTGQTGFDISALYHGLQLQLMVYMNAAVRIAKENHPGKQVIPAGVFYYRMNDPLVGKGDAEKRENEILKALRLDGIVNEEGESIPHLDHTGAADSTVIPVKYKKDGGLSKYSRTVGPEDFSAMLEYAEQKSGKLRQEIRQGEVAAHPYRQGNQTGCSYCAYRQICGFDPRLPGYSYANFPRLSGEEALANMKEQNREGEMHER